MANENDSGIKPVSARRNEVVGGTNHIDAWELPASVSLHGKFVAISGRELSRHLETLYESGVRSVRVIVDVPGRRLALMGTIYRYHNKQRGSTYYFIYPRDAAQVLLRELYFRHRGNASPNTKTPMPVVVVAVIPAEGV
jgi:hypothetical protein